MTNPKFPSEETVKRVDALRVKINRHNHLYYVLAKPDIGDREYDALYRELEELEEKHPELKSADSPTTRVGGAPLTEFQNITYAVPMMSLSNTYSKDELRQFDKRITGILEESPFTYILEPKIDGVAISLRYEHGLLTTASTRGDGKTGDDITNNIRTIRSIPLRLTTDSPPALLEVRGEAYMTKKGFAQLNLTRQENGQDAFANPRNATAGSLKLLDSKLVAERPLDAILYAVAEHNGISFATQEELLKTLSSMGFKTAPKYWKNGDISQIIESLDELDSLRHDFDFETDGGVIKVDERALYGTLGSTAKSPRWAVAYKYEPEQAETKINSISIQVGRTGVLTPVAELEPVLLAGSTVSRATLHNADEIDRKDIRTGDSVIIEKAGEIIPAVIKVITSARSGNEQPFVMPDKCPICGSTTLKPEDEVATRCINLQCPAQIKSWIKHFAARGAMDVDGLGDSLIEQLVDRKLIKNPSDLYSLKVVDVENLERMAEKSANNLIDGIDASRKRDLWRLLLGLGIRHVGSKSAQTLEEHFADIDKLASSTVEGLEELPDIGPIVAESITEFFKNENNQNIITKLKKAEVNVSRLGDMTNIDGAFSGQTFVLTGSLSTMTRDEAAEKIRAQGGKTSSSVSKKTSYLVAGESAGSKLAKAEKLGVNILTEEEFLNLTNS